jgi:hypothetical protein
MVEPIESRPRPIRAEVSDITNVVLGLTDIKWSHDKQQINGSFQTECLER